MPIRSASLLAAAALAALAPPSFAQDYDPGPPPPLPELDADEWDHGDYEDYGDYEDDGRYDDEDYAEDPYPDEGTLGDPWGRATGPYERPPHAIGYPPEERAAWLEHCRLAYDDPRRGLDECEKHLRRYERAFAGHGPTGYGYGYPYAPVVWVKVPIVTTKGSRDCGCERVVEEWLEEEPAPPPARSTKRVKIREAAPADKRVRVVK